MVGLDSIDTYVPLQSKHFQENSHIILAEPGYIYLHTCTLSSCVVRTVSYVVESPLTDCPSMGGRVNNTQELTQNALVQAWAVYNGRFTQGK